MAAAGQLVHDAFIYSSADEFLEGTVPFIADGIENGEPILAALTAKNTVLLQEELGDEADAVDWAEDCERHRPVERLKIFLNYIDRHVKDGAERVRVLGEPCWGASSGSGVIEWKRYESFLNVALGPHPVWLVCPYDGRELAADILDDACRTHPTLGYGEKRDRSPEYVEPSEFATLLDRAPLRRPPTDAAERYFRTISDVRRFVRERAEAARLPLQRVKAAELAAGEIASNAFMHASAVVRVRAWTEGGDLVCEIDDTGRGIVDPFAGYAVETGRPDPGLSIVRRMSDVAEIRSTPTGTAVRLRFGR